MLMQVKKPSPRIDWSFKASLALPAALIAICAVFTAIKPVFLTPDNLISIVH